MTMWHLAPYPSMSPTRLRAVGWTVTCVRPARERPIATRRCALWARDPRATTYVSWRGTRTVRATLCWIAWKVHCGVARCMPSFERSPADRGVGDLPHLPKVPTGRARQKYLRADEETDNEQIRGRGRATHDRADASSRRVHPQRHSPRRLYLTSRRGYTRSTRTYAPDRAPPPTPRAFSAAKQQQDVHQE